MSRRTERIASLLREIVADVILNRLNDPRIERLTSVTRVEVSPDLASAHVHLSVLASDARRRLCLNAIQGAAGRIRSCVADRAALRQAPELSFHLDDSLQRAFETVEIIDRAMAELKPPHGPDAADTRAEPGAKSDGVDGRSEQEREGR